MVLWWLAAVALGGSAEVLTEADCPSGTRLMGEVGHEQWCARGARREGPAMSWQGDAVRWRGHYASGRRDGPWVYLDPGDGSVVARGAYSRDLLDGLWVFVPARGRWEARYAAGRQVAWVGHQALFGDQGTVELRREGDTLVRTDTTDPTIIISGGVARPSWLAPWDPEHFNLLAVVFGPLSPQGLQTGLDPLYGVKRWQGAFDADGSQQGPWVRWHPSGAKASQGSYRAGVPVGPWRTWHRNGQPRSEGELDDRGRRIGPWRFWYDNGQLLAEGSYALDPAGCGLGCDGVRTGSWVFRHRSGMVAAEGTVEQGLSTFDESGQARPGGDPPVLPALAALLTGG